MKQHNFVSEGVSKLPPGFRFQPTDEELVFEYLRCKNFSLPLPASVIPEVHFSKLDPLELPGDSMEERYIFVKVGSNYKNGSQGNRATNYGYWEETGSEIHISPSSQNFGNSTMKGVKKTLVFHAGKSPNSRPTDWLMHEYSLVYKNYRGTSKMENWVVCHIFLKQRMIEENDDSIMFDYNGCCSLTSNIPSSCSSSSSSSNSFADVSSYDSQSDEESSYNFM